MHAIKKSVLQLVLYSSMIFPLSSLAIGQTSLSRIDSLEVHVREGQSDTMLYLTLYALTESKSASNIDSAVVYARQLIALAGHMKVRPQQIKARLLLGHVFLKAGMIDSVEQVMLRAIAQGEDCQTERCFLEKMHSIKLLRVPLRQQGKVKEIIQRWRDFLMTPDLPESIEFEVRRLMSYPLLEMGDYDQALRELRSVLEYGKKAGDDNLLCDALGELATTYYQTRQLDKFLQVAHERLVICQRLGRRGAVLHTSNQIGHAFLEQGLYDSAFLYYTQLLELVREEDNIYPYVLGGVVDTAPGMKRAKTEPYAEKASMFLRAKEAAGDQNLHQRQFLYGMLSRYYLYHEDFTIARQYAQKRLNWLRQFQSDTTALAADAFELLASTEAAVGNYEAAWQLYTTYHGIKMTMVNRNQEEALARTSVEMNLAENELARQKAEKANALEQLASAARTRFFLTLLGIAGVVLVLVLWAYRRMQKDQQLIREKSQQVEQSLAEKEVLLREIHHRVKNNLQIISGLLDKQARKSSDEAVRQLVREGQERIQSMALIHQNLYESDELSGIDIKAYLQELSKNIQKSQYERTEQYQLELNVAHETLDIDTAIPVGLILNELLTNCYKYAFRGKEKGKIVVDFRKDDKGYFLQVQDDGVGFEQEKVLSQKRGGIGLNLVKGLVRQLEGTLEWLVLKQGTAVTIRF